MIILLNPSQNDILDKAICSKADDEIKKDEVENDR